MKWKTFPISAETSIKKRYSYSERQYLTTHFKRARDKTNLSALTGASDDISFSAAYLWSRPKEHSGDLSVVIGKSKVTPVGHLTKHGNAGCSYGAEVERAKIKERGMKIPSFWPGTTTRQQWIPNPSHCIRQVLVANMVAEILHTTDGWQFKETVSTTYSLLASNQAFLRSTGEVIGRKANSKWTENWQENWSKIFYQMKRLYSHQFTTMQCVEKKSVTQFEHCSGNSNRLVKTMENVQQASIRKR